jgi:glutamate--cysteine ligase
MARDASDATPIESRAQLVETLGPPAASRRRGDSRWRVGTEHEKFGFYLAEHEKYLAAPAGALRGRARHPPAPRGDGRPPRLASDHGRGRNVIGLTDPTGQGAISLEPGGQFELSGAPLATIHQTCREVNAHLAQVRECATPLGIGFLGARRFSPKWTLAETPVMPKSRYAIMTRYMPKVGGKGLDMMYRTCTIQANLDFSDEADMVRKMRVGLALQPVATALFANSPFTEGKPNGFLSYRSRDLARHRPRPHRHAALRLRGRLRLRALCRLGARRADVLRQARRHLSRRRRRVVSRSDGRRLAQLPGERATLSDWKNHLSTLFPEVRLKNYIEMRGADGGPGRKHLRAAGVLGRAPLRFGRSMPPGRSSRTGRTRSVLDVAREIVALARAGLERRGFLNAEGKDETMFLAPLEEIVATGETSAERLLREFETVWKGDINEVFRRYAY